MKNNSVDVIIFLVRIICADVMHSCIDTPVVKIHIIQCITSSENNIKIVSEYHQEIPQKQTKDKIWHREEELHNNHETQGRQTKQSNQLFLSHQDDCKTRIDIK